MQTFKPSVDPLVRALIRDYYRQTDSVYGNCHPETCGCPECELIYIYPEYMVRSLPSDGTSGRGHQPESTSLQVPTMPAHPAPVRPASPGVWLCTTASNHARALVRADGNPVETLWLVRTARATMDIDTPEALGQPPYRPLDISQSVRYPAKPAAKILGARQLAARAGGSGSEHRTGASL